jgi:radical SAM superfamily enzyme YgiQ (UPF0313 family)
MGFITLESAKTRSLRDPGAILLVSCYELGHQPIGIAQLIGFLEQAGYVPASLDIAVEDFDEERVQRARFVGISVPMHTALRLGVRVAELVRGLNPACHICFYGLYASLNAEYLLREGARLGAPGVGGCEQQGARLGAPGVGGCEQQGARPRGKKPAKAGLGWAGETAPGMGGCARPVADSVIGGEYEVPFVKLIEQLERQPLTPPSPLLRGEDKGGEIEGVSVRGHLVAPFLKRVPTSSAFPVPGRSGLPALDRYARLERDGHQQVVGYVEASRGCLHHCLHCPIVPVYEGRFFVFPEPVVLEDIRRQVRAGATHITFGDPDFLNGPGHSLSIVRAMHGEFPHLTFDCTAKIEHLLKHRALLPELGALGCLFVISAVESFSDRVLAILAKGHTRADVITALALLRRAGIALRPSLVAFTPWTTLDDYLELFEAVEANELIEAVDPVQYSIRLLVPPGSALLTHPEIHQFLGPLDQAGFQYHWMHPDARMDRLHREVSAAVEEAAKAGEDSAVTFDRLRAMAYAVAERQPRTSHTPRSHSQPRPPRLTEPWFCCAEPTKGQFRQLRTKGHREV